MTPFQPHVNIDFAKFEYLTFDCYGTLVDWETGILNALRPVLTAHGVETTDDAVLHLYADFEARAERGEYKPYRLVLEQVVRDFGARMGFVPSMAEANSLPESLRNWQPFPDTVAALKRLATRYKLAIISNIDDDLFAFTAPKLGVDFAKVITAQQARSYKPALHNFRLALQRLGVPKEKVLHVAQSVYHDIVPTRQLGISNVWVNRRKGKSGFGATIPAETKPDLEVIDLKTLADLCVAEVRR